jgi:hypothetical protein
MATYGANVRAAFITNTGERDAHTLKSDWVKCHDDATTASTAILLNLEASGTFTGTHPAKRPDGATRFWWKIAVSTDATTFTTDPVVRWVATSSRDDDNPEAGVPDRLDVSDNGGTGQTAAIDGAATDFTYDSKYWSDTYGGTDGIDCRGVEFVFPLIETAAEYDDVGASAEAVEVWIQFGT